MIIHLEKELGERRSPDLRVYTTLEDIRRRITNDALPLAAHLELEDPKLIAEFAQSSMFRVPEPDTGKNDF
jgi:hypothetical protein